MEDYQFDPAECRSTTDFQRILHERARALARPGEVDEPVYGKEMLVLVAGPERYAVPVDRIREIQAAKELTPVPGVPPYWIGLVNLRGRLHPVLDLRRYLGQASPVENKGGKVLVIAETEFEIALMVDDLPELRRVSLDEIGAPLTETVGVVRGVVRGVTHDLVTVLDIDALLRDPQLMVKHESW